MRGRHAGRPAGVRWRPVTLADTAAAVLAALAVPTPIGSNAFKIFPLRVEPGQTPVVELAESHRTKPWKLGSYLVAGPVRPCVFENDPYWN